MRAVVDASALLPVLLSGGVLGPLEPHELVAPRLIRSEATSAIRELVFRGVIPDQEGPVAVARLANLPLTLHDPATLPDHAYAVATTLGWAKTYDAEYVALAVLLEAPLVTLDERLRRGASRLVQVIAPANLRKRVRGSPTRPTYFR